MTVLQTSGCSGTHEPVFKHLGAPPAKHHPPLSKFTSFSWRKSSCWRNGLSTLNLSGKALKKPGYCLYKKSPLPGQDRSSPSKDAPLAAPRPCCLHGGQEEGKVNAWGPEEKIILFFFPKVGFVQHLGAIPFLVGSGSWVRGPSGLARAPAVPNPNISGCLRSSPTHASPAQMDHAAASAGA